MPNKSEWSYGRKVLCGDNTRIGGKTMKAQAKRKIIDEMCYCGARKSEHSPQMHLGGKLTVYGHGPCERTKCRQFTWGGAWVYESSGQRRKR
jgi:hypothetical protein